MDVATKLFLEHFIASKKMQTQEWTGADELLGTAKINPSKFFALVELIELQYGVYEGFKLRCFENDIDFVRTILYHLNRLKKNAQDQRPYEIFKTFFTELYLAQVSKALKDQVDSVLSFLETRIDYFFSYTRKGLPSTNNNYIELITNSYVINSRLLQNEWDKVNYLAKLIVKHLNDHGFCNYFIDMDKMVNGEEIGDQVFRICEKADVFILLAEQATFRDLNTETNWCFREYEHFTASSANEKNILIFKARDLNPPADAGHSISVWYEHINLLMGEVLDSECGFYVFKAIIDKIANRIAEIKEDVFRKKIFSIN